ncbi:type II toxin-antitoxin system HicA family toxin [Aquisphaera insulae]|uniref:type II toxin-antitoxin system HicA family toxin n=1 Tax=Aquisphaera insulae TaxID=2712864 RepID=UPI0013ECA5EF|nr:type II toxin-antitoxin system HicA family toxin [Aquisphaera insulae]
MKPVSGTHLCKVLRRQGWVLIRINGSHHIYGRPDFPALLTVPVHGNRDMATGTQRALMRAAGLTDEDL